MSLPAIQAITDAELGYLKAQEEINRRLSIAAMSDAELRSAIDGAEDAYQRQYGARCQNMKIEAVFDSIVKEKSPRTDLTGNSRVLFGEGLGLIEASVNSGQLVLRSVPASRLVVVPMNSGAVRIEAQPL